MRRMMQGTLVTDRALRVAYPPLVDRPPGTHDVPHLEQGAG